MKPLVSVIIPVYNTAPFVGAMLTSVLDQSFVNFEIIIVNDGSTDGSADAIEPYLRDPRIRYFEQANAGVSAARNKGIELSTGKYIAFLDSDDLWHVNKLKSQLEYFDKHPNCSLVHGKIEAVDIEGNIRQLSNQEWWHREEWQSHATGFCYAYIFLQNPIVTSTVMAIKNVLLELGLFRPEIKTAEDYELWLRLTRKHEIGYINKTLAYYRRHDTNLSGNWVEMDKMTAQVLEEQLTRDPRIPQEIGESLVKNRLHTLYHAIAQELTRKNDYLQAKHYWKKALINKYHCGECYVLLALCLLPVRLSKHARWYMSRINAWRRSQLS